MTRTKINWRTLVAIVAFVPFLALAAPVQAQDASAGSGSTYELVVAVGKSQVLELPAPYTDVMVADPKVADVLPLTSHSVYIVGQALGSTAITLYGPNKHLLAAVDVVVSPDIEGFKARLHDILPDEKDVAVRAANESLVLSGTVSSPAALQQIMTLAESYNPGKIVNMMSVEGVQQVMLSVRFVEMERTTAKELGVNIGSTQINPANSNPQFAFNTTDTLANQFGTTVGQLAANYRWGPNSDISVVVDALEDKGLVKTLAEPDLTTMSGETASFLAGGEFPIPVSQTASAPAAGVAGAITIQFQQFGIALAFTPTILQDGLINLVVSPEVSSIDSSLSINTQGISIPGLKVRRAHATVELRDGESFTMAGLLSNDYQSNVNGLPFAGSLPILGALFRSQAFQTDQTELVIVVTPHLVTPRRGYVATPTDHFVPPSDFELFLLGQMVGEAQNVRPEDRVLLEADPTKGGIDGPHGHVLY
ncbi:MAG TPA: type II and III secretion system protein family protein [Caulobacteraceae bacterium]|nr:type II and III secretion system protein family protein [Caulobacteraceae bacterium]